MNYTTAIPEQVYNQLRARSNKLHLHDSKPETAPCYTTMGFAKSQFGFFNSMFPTSSSSEVLIQSG